MQHLGQTRSTVRLNYLLHTPDAFVRASLPGVINGTCIVHISPHLGAQFVQYTAELHEQGQMGSTLEGFSRFVFVHTGTVELLTDENTHTLLAGHYAFIPVNMSHTLLAPSGAKMTVIEKPYYPSEDEAISPPDLWTGDSKTSTVKALDGEPRIQLQTLLPDHLSFDFAVNIMTYPAGVSLPFVELHVMEHGLVMLEGEGIYKLDDEYHSVKTGDVIYMAPYCPQWFTSIGQGSAYLIYKDVNRHPHI